MNYVLSLLLVFLVSATSLAQVNGGAEKSKKELWERTKIEDVHGLFSGYRYRKFGDEVIDMWPIVESEYDGVILSKEIREKENALQQLRTEQYKKRSLGSESKIKRLAEEVKAIREKQKNEGDRVAAFVKIFGSVKQVTPEGLLFDNSFLINYPTKSVVDGSFIDCFAKPVGNYQFITVLGAQRTIRKYDFGVPISKEEWDAIKTTK